MRCAVASMSIANSCKVLGISASRAQLQRSISMYVRFMEGSWLVNPFQIPQIQQTKLEELNLIIKERRLRWLGHVLRMGDNRIPKQAMYWQADHNVNWKPGRPRKNWINTIRQDLKSIGMTSEDAKQSAIYREDWRRSVAQCVYDTGWPKSKSKIPRYNLSKRFQSSHSDSASRYCDQPCLFVCLLVCLLLRCLYTRRHFSKSPSEVDWSWS